MEGNIMSKRKVKKSAILIMGIICFFIIYFASFNYFSNLGKGEGTKIVDTEEKVDARSLLSQFKSKKKIYISDGNVSNVRMEEEKVQLPTDGGQEGRGRQINGAKVRGDDALPAQVEPFLPTFQAVWRSQLRKDSSGDDEPSALLGGRHQRWRHRRPSDCCVCRGQI